VAEVKKALLREAKELRRQVDRLADRIEGFEERLAEEDTPPKKPKGKVKPDDDDELDDDDD